MNIRIVFKNVEPKNEYKYAYLLSGIYLSVFFVFIVYLVLVPGRLSADIIDWAGLSKNAKTRVVIQEGHLINGMSFSPDGMFVATAGKDKTVKLWRVSDARLVRTFRGHSMPVNNVFFSNTGKYIISGSGDKTIRLWDTISGKTLRIIKVDGHLDALNISPDHSRLIMEGGLKKYYAVTLWSIPGGKLIDKFRVRVKNVTDVALSGDGRFAAYASDKEIVVHRASDGKKVTTLQRDNNRRLKYLTFSPDSKYLASAGPSVWRVSDWKKIYEGKNDRSDIEFLPDGRLVDTYLKIRDPLSGRIKVEPKFKGYTSRARTGVAVSPDGRYISGFHGNLFSIHRTSDGEEVSRFRGKEIRFTRDFDRKAAGSISLLGIGRGNRYFACNKGPLNLFIWDISKGSPINQQKVKRKLFLDKTVSTLVFHKNNKSVYYIMDFPHHVKLWDITGKKHELVINKRSGHDKYTVSPHGKYIACVEFDDRLALYETDSGKEVSRIKLSFGSSGEAAPYFSEDGKFISIRIRGFLGTKFKRVLYTVPALEKQITLPSEAKLIAFDPKGKLMAAADESGISIYNYHRGKELASIKCPQKILSMKISPDGKLLAAGTEEGIVGTWRLPKGETGDTFGNDQSPVYSLSFGRKGNYLFAGKRNGRIQIWNLKTGKPLTIIFEDSDNWAVIDAQGRFDCSESGTRAINIVKGTEIIEYKEGMKKFYRPRLFGEFLGLVTEKTLKTAKKETRSILIGRVWAVQSSRGTINVAVKNVRSLHPGSILRIKTTGRIVTVRVRSIFHTQAVCKVSKGDLRLIRKFDLVYK